MYKLEDLSDIHAFLNRPIPLILFRRVQELVWTVRRLGRRLPLPKILAEAPRRTQAVTSKPVEAPRIGAPREPVTFSLIVTGSDAAPLQTTLDSLTLQGSLSHQIILCAPDTVEPPATGDASRTPLRSERDLLSAAKNATCDFIIVLTAGDRLVEGALHWFADAIGRSSLDVVYCDETQVRAGSPDPVVCLKPGWSQEFLESFDYFGHATAIRTSLALRALECTLRSDPVSAQEWDLHLRASELTHRIGRIQKTLCTRQTDSSRDARCASDGDYRAHVGVLTRYWQRQGETAEVRSIGDGTFAAEWPLPREPLVSVIIPNRDRARLLRTCTEGISRHTNYKNVELVIVDNGSVEAETLALYGELTSRGGRIVAYDQPFNYSRACNMGAAEARGELLLFLNNDIEIIDPDWLTHLVRAAARPGVGIVGARLLYPDGEIQHAGVVVGLFTLAAHVFHRAPPSCWGPLGSPETPRNWMAVTGACQLMSRAVFDLVGGYDETFDIAYSDVVLCLDASKYGYRTVYAAHSTLIHHEGKTRGFENPTADQILFARRLRALGITSDPFFHGRLDTCQFVPVLAEPPNEAVGASHLQIDVARLAGEPASGPIDIFDDGFVAAVTGRAWDRVAAAPTKLPAAGADAMARIMIELLRRRPDLRDRFPRALSEGASGGFATWLKGAPLGIGEDLLRWIDAAFAAKFDARPRQLLFDDEALRREEPLFLLPNGRRAVCHALFEAHDRGELSLVDIWWFLLIAAEDPVRELHATWAMTPAWQAAVPAGGSVFGTVELRLWVANAYDVRDDWLFAQHVPASPSAEAQVRLAYFATPRWQAAFPEAMSKPAEAAALLAHLSKAPDVSFLARDWLNGQDLAQLALRVTCSGVNVLGHFAHYSNPQGSIKSIIEGLRVNDIATSLRNVPAGSQDDGPIGDGFDGCEIYDVSIVQVEPTPFFDRVHERARLLRRQPPAYLIGFWHWDFDTIPSAWDRFALGCDEFWAATRFVADGLTRRYKQPVKVMHPGIEIPSFEAVPRSHFQLEDAAFLFLCVFDMRSGMERKNPLASIKAFGLAFTSGENARLVIKTTSGQDVSGDFARLRAAAAAENVILIDETYSNDETSSLIACCDAYVSLHRSEGLGSTMAEAMLSGRPVIATRYSGNLDFMDDANSLLVDCTITDVDRGDPSYQAGGKWAEPSIACAAAHMRRLYDDPSFARTLGAQAKADLESRLSYRAAGKRMKDRVLAIAAERSHAAFSNATSRDRRIPSRELDPGRAD